MNVLRIIAIVLVIIFAAKGMWKVLVGTLLFGIFMAIALTMVETIQQWFEAIQQWIKKKKRL